MTFGNAGFRFLIWCLAFRFYKRDRLYLFVTLYKKKHLVYEPQNYYGYKKPEEHHSIRLYDEEKTMGTMLSIAYVNGKFSIVKVNWGTEEDKEHSRDGEVEMNWWFDEENTNKLMLRTGTHNGGDMIQAMYELFKEKVDMADFYITGFCDEKKIKYTYNAFY